jgi:hypothetical protein
VIFASLFTAASRTRHRHVRQHRHRFVPKSLAPQRTRRGDGHRLPQFPPGQQLGVDRRNLGQHRLHLHSVTHPSVFACGFVALPPRWQAGFAIKMANPNRTVVQNLHSLSVATLRDILSSEMAHDSEYDISTDRRGARLARRTRHDAPAVRSVGRLSPTSAPATWSWRRSSLWKPQSRRRTSPHAPGGDAPPTPFEGD